MDRLPQLSTFKAVFDELGGYKGLGELTGAKTSAVSNWVKNQQFPARTYLQITSKLRDLGHEADSSLWSMAPSNADAA